MKTDLPSHGLGLNIKNTKIRISQSLLYMFLFLQIMRVNAYPSCEVFALDGYQFDLTPLQNQQYFIAETTTGLGVQIQFCSANLSCNSTKTFVKYPSNTNCEVYALSENPLKQDYTLIKQSDPNAGIMINYLPYIKETTLNNSTTTNQYNFVLKIQCNEDGSTSQNKCTNTVTKISNSYFINTLTCIYQSTTGCPTLQKGHFWQFLIQNAVILAIFLWAISLFELFFGYMAIRLTIFFYGVLTGSVFGIIYTAQNYVDFIYQDVGYGINIFIVCMSIFMGFLLGITLLTIPKLGYVNIGLWVAVIFSLLLQNSVFYLSGNLLAFYITVGVTGLIMTIISLLALRNFIILSSSLISAFWIVRPLGFFLPYYPNQFFSGQSYLLTNSTSWQFYLYLLSIIIIAILGSVFQFCCFKKARGKGANQHFYLQNDSSIKQKLKNLFEFQQIKDLVKSGKEQILFLKKLVVDSDTQQEEQDKTKKRKGSFQQMKNKKQIQLSVIDSSFQEKDKRKNKKANIRQEKQVTNSSSGNSKAKVFTLQSQPKQKKSSNKEISKGKKAMQKQLALSSDSENQQEQEQIEKGNNNKNNNKNRNSSSPGQDQGQDNIRPNRLVAPIRQKPGKK